VLKKTGVNVIVVNDGQEACEYCDKHTPNFVLMDINMPNCNGIEATKYLRKKRYTMPIFALSAETDQKKIDAGCDDTLSKPLDKKALYRTLTHYLSKEQQAVTLHYPQS